MTNAMRLLLVAVLVLGVTACERDGEGAAENAGEKIDEAVRRVEPALRKAGEEVGEVMEKAGEKLQERSEAE